jgi:hypothetical protein
MREAFAHEAEFRHGVLDPVRAVPAMLSEARGGDVTNRFAVYRNNVTVSLVAALAAIYPATARIVGADAFSAAAREFVRHQPPRSPILHRYGDEFPAFLATFEPFASLPYLSDVARLERAWLDAYHAADAAPLDGAALGALPPEQLFSAIFEAHPATRLVSSPYAQVDIFVANRAEHGGGRIDASRPQVALVTRQALDVRIGVVDAGQASFLQRLIAGESLAEAIEAAMLADQQFDLPAALSLMLGAGAFSAIRPAAS